MADSEKQDRPPVKGGDAAEKKRAAIEARRQAAKKATGK